MRYLYAVICLSFAVLAFSYTPKLFRNGTYKVKTWLMFTLLSLASGVWSLGYGLMFYTSNFHNYPLYRVLGMSGIILYMIFGQLTLALVSEKTKVMIPIISVETLLGIIVLNILSDRATYSMRMTSTGIVTMFVSDWVSYCYTGYVLVIAVVFVVLTVKLAGSGYPNRLRNIGTTFVKMEILIGIGMIVDTILPAFGINPNIPASTLFQFIGLQFFNRAVLEYNRNVLDMNNMAKYIFSSLKTPVCVFDSNHTLKTLNHETATFFNIKDNIIGTDLASLFWTRYFGIVDVNSKFDGYESVTFEEVDLVGKRHCKISIDPIFDDYYDHLGYIMSIVDMTPEISLINELAVEKKIALEAQENAEKANHAKSMFLGNMSHEMRTPLNAIMGFSMMAMKTEKNLSPTVYDYFKDIHTSSEILLDTVNSVLDVSRIESGNMELINVSYCPSAIFEEIQTIIGILAKQKGIDFRMDISDDFPDRLFGDRQKVSEIVSNLINNAVKYTNEGFVSLSASVISTNDNKVTLKFIVSDSGIGIMSEDLNSIFEIFKRVDIERNAQTEGSGLGLSIVKGYVDLMGGSIKVESNYGQGSTFTVVIEQEVETTVASIDSLPGAEKVSHNLYLKNLNILAVDDKKVNLKLVEDICSMYEVKCDCATSGLEAIEMAKMKNYEIILMDQMMPVMDGIETMNNIRALGSGYEKDGPNKIIALTANTMIGVREEMLAQGFDGYLSKPVNLQELEELLERYLDESQLVYEFKF